MGIVLVTVVTIVANFVGTLSGYGASAIVLPSVLPWLPLAAALFMLDIVHWFGNIWKILFFREGWNRRILIAFCVPGVLFTWLVTSLAFQPLSVSALSQISGVGLILFSLFIFMKPHFKIADTTLAVATSGTVAGIIVGILNVCGAVICGAYRAAALATFDLPKEQYIVALGSIGFLLDSTRLVGDWKSGTFHLIPVPLLVLLILASLVGAFMAKKIADRIPQRYFRLLVVCSFLVVALKMILYPTDG